MENAKQNIPNKVPAIKIIAGLFVMAVCARAVFLYWHYYTHDELMQFVPSDARLVVYVKEALAFQKKARMTDTDLRPFFQYLDSFLGWPLDFQYEIVPHIDKEFALAVAPKPMLIFKSKNIAALKEKFEKFDSYGIRLFGENIIGVYFEKTDDTILTGGRVTPFDQPGYHFLKIYMTWDLILDTFFSESQTYEAFKKLNTKLVQSENVSVYVKKVRGIWMLYMPEKSPVTRSYKAALRLNAVPDDFEALLVGFEVKDFFDDPDIRDVDILIRKNSFLAATHLPKNILQEQIEDRIRLLVSKLMAEKKQTILPDKSVSYEIVARSHETIVFEEVEHEKNIRRFSHKGYEYVYSVFHNAILFSNSLQAMEEYYEQLTLPKNNLQAQLKRCWSDIPSEYIILRAKKLFNGFFVFNRKTSGIFGCAFP